MICLQKACKCVLKLFLVLFVGRFGWHHGGHGESGEGQHGAYPASGVPERRPASLPGQAGRHTGAPGPAGRRQVGRAGRHQPGWYRPEEYKTELELEPVQMKTKCCIYRSLFSACNITSLWSKLFPLFLWDWNETSTHLISMPLNPRYQHILVVPLIFVSKWWRSYYSISLILWHSASCNCLHSCTVNKYYGFKLKTVSYMILYIW